MKKWKEFITRFKNLPPYLRVLLVGLLILLPLFLILPIVYATVLNPLFMNPRWILKTKNLTASQKAALYSLCKAWQLDINWLCKVVSIETSGTFNPKIVNSIGAKGWFQFMPDTARDLGYYPVPDSAELQCEMFDKYLRMQGFKPGQFKNEAQLYIAVFYPIAAFKDPAYVLGGQSSVRLAIARANPGFDTNNDKQITVGEITQYVYSY